MVFPTLKMQVRESIWMGWGVILESEGSQFNLHWMAIRVWWPNFVTSFQGHIKRKIIRKTIRTSGLFQFYVNIKKSKPRIKIGIIVNWKLNFSH